jgi:hypothetical protein
MCKRRSLSSRAAWRPAADVGIGGQPAGRRIGLGQHDGGRRLGAGDQLERVLDGRARAEREQVLFLDEIHDRDVR